MQEGDYFRQERKFKSGLEKKISGKVSEKNVAKKWRERFIYRTANSDRKETAKKYI